MTLDARRDLSRHAIPVPLSLLLWLALIASVIPAAACLELPAASSDGTVRSGGTHATSASPISASDLIGFEQFWPYRVRLTRPWTPGGSEAEMGPGVGVLLYVIDGERARIDFGRFGKHDVPIEVTNLVEQSNRIRAGLAHKSGANLFRSLGLHLLDVRGDRAKALPATEISLRDWILVRGEASRRDDVAAMAEVLNRLDADPRVRAVFVAEDAASLGNLGLGEALRGSGWRGAALRDAMTPSALAGYFGAERPAPWVLFLSHEGRPLFDAAWSPDALPRLERVIRTRAAERIRLELPMPERNRDDRDVL